MLNEGIALGHYISSQGIKVDPAKIQIIVDLPIPQNQREVRSLLGYASYYRSFIEHFSKIDSPLFKLLTKYVLFNWNENCQQAFELLKKKLSTAPVLRGPNWSLPFHIFTDAFDTAVGASLGQKEESCTYAIYFISKNLTPAELNYTVREKETLAIIYAVNKFRHYITGYEVFVHTDHSAIKHLMNKPITSGRVTRWLLLLQEFNITVLDRPAKRTTFKLLILAYYWPSIFKDAKKYVKSCDSYQRMGRPTATDEMPLQPQVHLEPFEKWALDFIGPINPTSNGKKYILVCTNYVTKWAEAKALVRATEHTVVNFLFEEIFVRYGVPREIVTDQGTQFTSKLVKDITDKYQIKHRRSTLYHPQANGQVESTNKTLEGIIAKTVAMNRKNWEEKLKDALWAYRITWKDTTGFTTYQLVYGKEVMLPIEFQIHTFKLAADLQIDLDQAQQERIQQLNQLDELRQQAEETTILMQKTKEAVA
eukprot:PITA_18791